MESAWNLLAGLGLFMPVALFLLLKQRKSRVDTKIHPPGPPAWPIFGNIFDLGAIPHHTFYKLKEKYGPVIWLKLGYTNTLVIQSAETAAELFKNHDLAFSDRKVPLVLTAHNYSQGSMSIGRYGPNWRMLRRLYSSKLMITKQLDQTKVLRQKCIDDMIKYIEEDVAEAQAQGESGEIKVAHYPFLMTFNLIGNLLLSRDLVNPRSIDGHEFYDAMNNVMKWAGTPNVADFFPFLKWVDPQGIMRNMVQDMGKAVRIVEKFVKERTEEWKSGRKKTNDFLDALLEYEGDGKDEPDVISDQNRRTIILELFFTGSETTSTTIEWAMTELLRDPVAMGRATEELHQVVGPRRKGTERICVGMSLAHRVLHLGLASMLHCFEWELGGNYTPETLDMNEGVGITTRKLKPLRAKPKRAGRTTNDK
ncbi:hypothetical protein SADUNF_Sadunf06G0094700 [Salix dunnii]|uniref:Cytochrome P450 n=1 Tax=Salix dunnii TaxID=1413687 RepID=A0A835N2W5_9ROSI|nr:hypothetical protein SADUNF_Sadunf06G0094700 [Salix dunnii]